MKHQGWRSVTIVFALFLAGASNSPAVPGEADQRGRLPDGRAYRVDLSGNELIDYIAELEVTIDGLNREVRALRNEIDAKQKIIDRLQSGFPEVPAIIEKDIVDSEAERVSLQSPSVTSEVRSEVTPEASKDIEQLKNRAKTQITKLQSLISTRDTLFRQYGSKAEGVTINPASIVSSDGLDTDTLKKQLEAISSEKEFTLIEHAIGEMRTKVDEDLAFIRRFQK